MKRPTRRYRRYRRPRTVLKKDFPVATVHALHQYENETIDVSLYFDTTLIPSKRLSEFPLGQKFKLVPIE